MPKVVTLVNQHISVEKGSEIDAQASEQSGAPVVQEMYTIVLTDRTYADQIRISFNKETRDEVVKNLMGGIVLGGV